MIILLYNNNKYNILFLLQYIYCVMFLQEYVQSINHLYYALATYINKLKNIFKNMG